MPLIVLPKSCSCRCGPCPPPLSLVWVVCFLSFFYDKGADWRGLAHTPAHTELEFTPWFSSHKSEGRSTGELRELKRIQLFCHEWQQQGSILN